MAARPDTPLREIASLAGVSLATARDVRTRVREGRDPVPEQVRALEKRRAGNRLPQSDAPNSWARLRDQLRADPSLRFTEAGRELLRWLDSHSLRDDCRTVADRVPAHCAELVACIARDNAAAWCALAQELDQRVNATIALAD